MAAYTALASLINTIDQIQNHPCHSFSFDKNQMDSLRGKALYFLEFIESYTSQGRKIQEHDLEKQIIHASLCAEDLLESNVIDQILAGSTLDHGEDSSSFLFDLRKRIQTMKSKVMNVAEKIQSKVDATYRERMRILSLYPSYSFDLEELLENRMYSIREKVEKFKEERRIKDQEPTDSMPAASSRLVATGKTTMVGFDAYFRQLMDVLTGQQSTRQVCSILGMGGIGKTTLARNVYEYFFILHHFDIRAWVTISQKYNVKEILLELLSRKGQSTRESIADLGEQLHKKLWGGRYLIVLDDVWSTNVWDKIMVFFPDNGNSSRVVITTRLANVARQLSSSPLVMKLLDEDKSWELFCAKTFGEEDFPLDLVDVGKEIVELCKGLPLSLVVTAGHLRKSSKTLDQWTNVGRHMVPILDSVEDQCLSVLSLSYSHLPAFLKPCFLYMGIFPKNKEIDVSTLIRLWVAEGFLSRSDYGPGQSQSMEEIGMGYITDLVDRNLILAQKQGRNGKIITCKIHDLLRKLCWKVGGNDKFFCVLKHPLAASRCKDKNTFIGCLICRGNRYVHHGSRLLKIVPYFEQDLQVYEFDPDCPKTILFQHFNARYIRRFLHWHHTLQETAFTQVMNRFPYVLLPSSISLHWNLQSLVISGPYFKILAPPEIWGMLQLRNLVVQLIRLPNPPPSNQGHHFVMQNLQTLSTVENFRPNEEVCRRIPNIKELRIHYNILEASLSLDYCQQNLDRFHKLESLVCEFSQESNNWRVFALSMTYPSSLRELWLGSSCLHWEDLSKIGSLPNLEVFKMTHENAIKGSEWNPTEGEFLGLKYLEIYHCEDLVCWNAEWRHFPVLQTLTLGFADKLVKFPLDIGDIPTLQRIKLDRCSVTAAISAMRMLIQQEEFGNEDLRLEVQCGDKKELERVREMMEKEGLESKNLHLIPSFV